MTVYLLQKPPVPRNLESAVQFGLIHTIIEDENAQVGYAPARIRRLMEKELIHFDVDEDYLVQAGGDPWMLFVAGMVVSSLFPGKPIMTLRWERELDETGRRRGYYVPVNIHG